MGYTLQTLLEDADRRATLVGADGRTVRLLALQLLTWAYKTRSHQLPDKVPGLDEALLQNGYKDCFASASLAIRSIYPLSPPLAECWNHVELLSWLGVVCNAKLGKLDVDDIHELVTRPYAEFSAIRFVEPEVIKFMVHLLGDVKGVAVYCPFDLSGQFVAEIARRGGKPTWHSPVPYSAITSIQTLCGLNIQTQIGNPLTDGAFRQKFNSTVAIFPGRQLMSGNEINRIKGSLGEPEDYFVEQLIEKTSGRLLALVSGAVLKHHNPRQQATLTGWYTRHGFNSVTELPSIRILGANTTQYVLDLNVKGNVEATVFAKGSSPDYTDVDGRKKAIFSRWQKLADDINSLLERSSDMKGESLSLTSTQADTPSVMAVRRERLITEGEVRLNPTFQLAKHDDEPAASEHRLLAEIADFIRPVPILKRAVDESGTIDDSVDGELALELSTSQFSSYGYTALEGEARVEVKQSRSTAAARIRPNDIIVLCKGADSSVGKVAIVPPEPISTNPWCVSQMCMIVRLKPEADDFIDPRVLYMFLRMPSTKLKILSLVSTDLVRNLRASELGTLKVPRFKTHEVAGLVESFEKLNQLEQQIRRLRKDADSIFGQTFMEWFAKPLMKNLPTSKRKGGPQK